MILVAYILNIDKEEQKYQKFLDYLEKHDYELPEALTKRRIMRFLQSCHWKNSDTYKNITQHLQFREEMGPIELTDDMK